MATSDELLASINVAISELQTAQQTVVKGAALLGEHNSDPNAHGGALGASTEEVDAAVAAHNQAPSAHGLDTPDSPMRQAIREAASETADQQVPVALEAELHNPQSLINQSISSCVEAVIEDKIRNGEIGPGGSGGMGGDSGGGSGDSGDDLPDELLAGSDLAAPGITAPAALVAGVPFTFTVDAVPDTGDAIASFEVFLTGQGVQTLQAIGNRVEATYTLPDDTAIGTRLRFAAVAVSGTGKRSFKASVLASTVAEQVLPPVFTSPADDAELTPQGVTWTLDAFAVAGKTTDTHVASRYRIVDEGGDTVYDSGERTAASELTTWTATEFGLPGSGSYTLQAAFKGAALGWSPYGERQVRLAGVMPPALHYPTGGDVERAGLVFITSAFAAYAPDTHMASQYRIRTLDGETVYESGSVTDHERHELPNSAIYGGGLELGKLMRGAKTRLRAA